MAKELLDTLLDYEIPDDIKFSPNGLRVVYTTSLPWGHRKGDYSVSTIWMATSKVSDSARPLTNGSYNDTAPQWNPDGESIAFLSDRRKPGEANDVCIMALDGGEPFSVSRDSEEQPIEKFSFSPNGTCIAYLSPDEKTESQKTKETTGDDSRVWGEDWPLNRLRVRNLATKISRTLVSSDAHISDFAWDDGGEQILFTEVKTTDVESAEVYGTTFSVVCVSSAEVRRLCHFPNEISHLIWPERHVAYFRSCYTERSANSAMSIYRLRASEDESSYERYAYGEYECVLGLKATRGQVLVNVWPRMKDEIRLLNGRTLFSGMQEIAAWDFAPHEDGVAFTIAVATSNTNRPAEVYTCSTSTDLVQLSCLGGAGSKPTFGSFAHLSCPSLDDKFSIDSVWLTPKDAAASTPGPTVVLVHGGPYDRVTDSFDGSFFCWIPLLLSYGYSVLIPNYRGSSGQGEEFASFARGLKGGGILDYSDIIAATQHAISLNLADAERLVIGGWSQGGFFAYLAAVRNGVHGLGWTYKGAIAGAGVSDSDALILTSDLCWAQAEAAGVQPWLCNQSDTRNRNSSAIWQIHEAISQGTFIPPMLILHGENDKRCPLEQARGMRRALEHYGLPHKMVVYQGEEHCFEKRKNLVDLGLRVLNFVTEKIGPGCGNRS